jgi:hypothetical protein
MQRLTEHSRDSPNTAQVLEIASSRVVSPGLRLNQVKEGGGCYKDKSFGFQTRFHLVHFQEDEKANQRFTA